MHLHVDLFIAQTNWKPGVKGNYSKIYLTQSVSVWTGLIWLRLETGSGLL